MSGSKPIASRTRGAPGHEPRAAVGPQPARQTAGRAGHRHAARVSRCSRRPGSPGAAPARPPPAGSAPFCGANVRAASSQAVRTSHSTSSLGLTPASARASSAPAPPSVVAEPPTRHQHRVDAVGARGSDQLAGAAGRRGPAGRARRSSTSPSPLACGALHDRASSGVEHQVRRARTGLPSGSLTSAARRSPPSAAASDVHGALAAVSRRGSSTASAPARAQPALPPRPPPPAPRACP